MNKLTPALAIVIMVTLTSCASSPSWVCPCDDDNGFKRPRLADLKYEPIDSAIPKTKRVTLTNGMVVHLLPDHMLPLFKVTSMIRTGSIWEPGDKAGLASLTGATMRSGGTTTRSPEELDETLEFIAGSVETSIGSESGTASLSVLAKDTDLGLEILADVIRHPRFDPDRFDLAKARMLEGIRRENDDPTNTAGRELKKLIYAGSPYGGTPTIESVERITREDVIRFHAKYFVPQNIMLGVTGDFDEKTIISKLEKVFGDFRGADTVFPRVAPVERKFEGGVYFVKKSIPQSVIRMGHLAGRKTDPDYHALRVMDNILGGSGFTSRLVQSVRTDRGLAYSVWSYTMAGRWERGQFMAGAETKAASTVEVVRLIKNEIKRIRTEPVTQTELDEARDSIVNRFIFIFDKPFRILKERMIVEYYGLPDDYLESFRGKIMAVTADDILKAAQAGLHPDGLKIVVVGDSDKFEGDLSEYGNVVELELGERKTENGPNTPVRR